VTPSKDQRGNRCEHARQTRSTHHRTSALTIHYRFAPYQEGPRLSPPQGAIPIQGEAVLGDEFPINPITSDDTSLQRGQILYDVHCALCHGLQGLGNGPLAEHFQRIPVDLAGSAAVNEFDGSVYLVILQGFGQMPSLSENLTIRERWDVVNYVRTLTEPTGVK